MSDFVQLFLAVTTAAAAATTTAAAAVVTAVSRPNFPQHLQLEVRTGVEVEEEQEEEDEEPPRAVDVTCGAALLSPTYCSTTVVVHKLTYRKNSDHSKVTVLVNSFPTNILVPPDPHHHMLNAN